MQPAQVHIYEELTDKVALLRFSSGNTAPGSLNPKNADIRVVYYFNGKIARIFDSPVETYESYVSVIEPWSDKTLYSQILGEARRLFKGVKFVNVIYRKDKAIYDQ